MREKEFLPQVQEKLGISKLNDMQLKMMESINQQRDIILLSPTGSGKTLAFILPMLKYLKPSTGRVQAIVIAPSRELVLQIAGIIRPIAAGYKVTVLYGGHKVEDEVNTLQAGTDIIVATPGRMLDHINRRNIDVLPCRMLVLDEFDKSLELGFESEMKKIMARLKNVSRVILTSATRSDALPDFLKLTDPMTLDYLGENKSLRKRVRVYKVEANDKDKLESLGRLLRDIASRAGKWERIIVFVNHRESAERVAGYLRKQKIPAVLYHGALDQHERESAIARFNNGSRPILVATDLASRGLDIEDVKSVVHYHQPLTAEVYTHRNGRTARVDREGEVYLLIGPEEDLKEYVEIDAQHYPEDVTGPEQDAVYETLRFSAGKKEKLSKGDILGFLTKTADVPGDKIGKIDVYDHYALAAVDGRYTEEVVEAAKIAKIKGEKRLVSVMR